MCSCSPWQVGLSTGSSCGAGVWHQVLVIDTAWVGFIWHFMQIVFDETAASDSISFSLEPLQM